MGLEPVDGVDVRRYSAQPCPLCGWHHQLDAFRWGMNVVVNSARTRLPNRPTIYLNALGVVREWSQYGGTLYVRVQFPAWPIAPMTKAEHEDHRENFYPCELEHA